MNINYLHDLNRIIAYNEGKMFRVVLTMDRSINIDSCDFQTMINVTNLPLEFFDQTFVSANIKFKDGELFVERITGE